MTNSSSVVLLNKIESEKEKITILSKTAKLKSLMSYIGKLIVFFI